MKKYLLVFVLGLSFILTACSQTNDVQCGEGTKKVDGQCVIDDNDDDVTCETGYHVEFGSCVIDEVDEDTCEIGYHEEDGLCVVDDDDEVTCDDGYHEENGNCVMDNTDIPDWFDDWQMLNEPVGDISVNGLQFTETGFSVNLPINQRVGIQMVHLTLEEGFSYEVRFDYNSSEAGKGIFVQLQGHAGNVFTNPGIITTGSSETFSQTLPMPPNSGGTTDGWLTIELTPSGVGGTVSIENIELVKTALPTCGENEILSGLECIPSNNGYIPNGTPTAWFDGWNILTIPGGNKEVSDYEFSEVGFTTYLGVGERTGIEFYNYVFESGYTYEFRFDYTAGVAGRLVWVQLEALGGYNFTNTDTWTSVGTNTFSQSITIPDSYVPTETGWLKIELAPGAMDNITIENIEVIKTVNE